MEVVCEAQETVKLVKASPLPKEMAAALAFSTFQKMATRSIRELKEVFDIVYLGCLFDASLPLTAIAFGDFLKSSSREWLGYINKDQADEWRRLAAEINKLIKKKNGR